MDEQHTYIVKKTCPVCGKETRVIKTKLRLVANKTDVDFCVHYRDFVPYFYHIWFCENCGFAADEAGFLKPMPQKKRQKIAAFLSSHQLALQFTPVRGVPEAVASYKLAIFYAELTEESLAHRAGLYLHLAWVYREAGDKEHENQALQKAADLYDLSLMKEHYPMGSMTDNMVIYLIGAIYFELGNIEKATQYLSRIISDNSVRIQDAKLFDRSRDLWQLIREQKEN